jgi:hypothetical protein
MTVNKNIARKWAQSFKNSGIDDVMQELELMRLEIAAGVYCPAADLDDQKNLGIVFLELKKRLGEKQISVGGTGGTSQDEDEIQAFEEGIIDATTLIAADAAEFSRDLDDFIADLNSLMRIETDSICKMFGVKERQARQIRNDDLIGGLLRRAARMNGLDDEGLKAMAVEVMSQHKGELA